MAITTKTFTDLLRGQVAAIQGSASALQDFRPGSILRAAAEAFAQVALWLQGLILVLLATTRAATSSGADLDSYVGDFGVARLGASSAVGPLTFARFSATAPGLVPVGALAETADGSIQFLVTTDTANAAWNDALGGYVLGIGVGSLDVPATAQTAGAAGNAVAGAINTIVSAIPGIDTVTNGEAFAGGEGAETDAALRRRFVDYLASLQKATRGAVDYAVESVQVGVDHALVENEDYDGTPHPGYFYVVVDDGTGTPDSDFLSAVGHAIEATRPLTSTFGVFAPVLLTADVAMTIHVAAGYVSGTVVAAVQAALSAYINGLGLDGDLAFTRLAQVAYDASPGVSNITAVTLNSGTSDLIAAAKEVIKAGTFTLAAA
jgi:uncharacterized phage protein gp47/JayE